jgi:formiminoglutamate deiminase
VAAFWCEQAWLGGEDVADGVVLTVTDGQITSVERDVPAAPAGSTRLDGLTLPGFANTHSHSFHRALRGRTHSAGGTFWTWRDRMYELAATLEPDTFEAVAAAAFAEMVAAGYTVVGEFHYLHHRPGGGSYSDRNELGRRLISAAERAGIRVTLLDTCYLRGGFDEPVNEVQSRFSDGAVERWIDRVAELEASGLCRIGTAVHSVRAVDPQSIRVLADWAGQRDSVVHAHVSEQPQENVACIATHGVTPTELLDAAGALGPRFTAVHATHVTASDIERLAATASRCCICPTTERELADGIGATAAWRNAGVEMCVGSDSHAVIDPFEEARAVELDERLASLQRGTHRPHELLTAATRSGYDSLGWPGGGRLAVGALADFVTVGFDSPRLAGTDRQADPLAAVVFAAAPSDIRHVVVGGAVVVDDGVHRRVDVVAELEQSISAAWAAAR